MFQPTPRSTRSSSTSQRVPWAAARRLIAPLAGALAMAFASTAMAAPPTDAQILGIYIQVNGFDIETALLGRTQGQAAAVRALGEHVSRDHIGVRHAAFELAAKCGLTPELPAAGHAAAREHSATVARLQTLQGMAFDEAYLKHEVAFHQAAIGAVREVLLPSARCEALKTHLQTVLPAFEHHLAQSRTLAEAAPSR